MTQAWSLKTSNHTQKLILLKLADNASDEGVCWPSMQTIASQCQCERRTVVTHINLLQDKGWLKISHRFKSDGSKNSNQYLLTLPMVVKEDHIGSELGSHRVGKEDHNGREGDSHKPSMNHQLEPSLNLIVRNDDNDDLFDSVWREYPSKVNKKKGKALFLAYIKKNKLDAHQFTDQLIQDIESRCKNQQFGFDKLHFTTYMNGERFNDDYQKGDNNNSIDYDFNKLDFGG